MRALRWVATVAVVILALIALASLTSVFVMGYMACARPGSNPGLNDAAFISFGLTMTTGFGAAFGFLGLSVLWEDAR